MIKPIKIKEKIIGEGYPTFLIAEMACAHQGDVKQACELVDVAIRAKADAVQIQVYKKEIYMSPVYESYDLITRLELSQSEWLLVINKIKKNNILFFAAGYDVDSVKFLIENGVDAFKIHSADISNPEVLKEVVKSRKPIFLSCGASKVEEIKKAVDSLRKNGAEDVILMHGYQGFPTKVEDNHLNYIKTLRRLFGLNVGYYDHVDGGSILAKIIPIMAIGYGAQVIEKHFILSREEKGIDYESSLNTDDLIEFVDCVRNAEKAIGQKNIRDFTDSEINYRAYCKKSIVLKNNIPKGTKISREDVMFVRSDPGIPPDKFKDILGNIARKDLKKNNNLRYDDF